MELLHKTNIDFIGKRRTWFMFSIVMLTLGILLPAILGVRMGIDFTGGTEVAIGFPNAESTQQIREVFDRTGLEGAEIKSFGGQNQFLIRAKQTGGTTEQITDNIKRAFPGVTILKVNKVGPKVGKELRMQAFLAVLVSIVLIAIYIAFRFEFVYGIGAIIALVHDVIVAVAALSIAQLLGMNIDFDQPILAALLTVVGFSINDTVIIFDRIRENQEHHVAMPLIPLMNLSINETLSRTINTVLTVVLVLLTMVLVGGEVLRGFSLIMLVGILVGTYSSIYIASSFVIWYLQHVKKQDVEGDAARHEAKAAMRAVKA